MRKILFIFLCLCGLSLDVPGVIYAGIDIHELMYNPLSMNSDEEFIELHNSTNDDVDLSGWSLQTGVRYQFPAGTTLPAGGYIIISPAPDEFRAIYVGVDALGPYTGHLNNDGETIVLVDAEGTTIDKVEYHDEEGWPQEADGLGNSLERIHPEMLGSRYESWRSGPLGGTPGKANSSEIDQPVAIVFDVRQTPIIPSSTESVQITCQITHVRSIEQVVLWYKSESSEIFETTPLFDDGNHGDSAAADGIYGGTIPPFASGTIVEFSIKALDTSGESGWYPLGGVVHAAIYQVDDTQYETDLPLYHIVLRTADNALLRSRDPFSNDELLATFIYGDEIWYNVGLRFRGKGSRGKEPKSYRVNFTNSRYFGSIRKLNLNAVDIYRQYVGLETMKRLGMPVPEKQFVSLSFNQVFVPGYIQVERTDQYMMDRIFGDGSGNVYRGIENGIFDYRGEDKEKYRAHYEKQTNEREDDYTDIISLSKAFSTTSDEEFIVTLGMEINIQQWIRWFAIKEILNDMEGGLSLDRGDDYYIYKNPGDNLFYLLPWDLDSVLKDPVQPIHHHQVLAIQRLLRHPDLARFYYSELLKILDQELTQETMDSIIDETAPITSEKRLNEMKQMSREIRASIYKEIPRTFTIEPSYELQKMLVLESDPWHFHRGSTPPPEDWNQNGFDDSTWEIGPGGFGYGDNDDQTVLDDMRNQYSTVFIRNTFTVNDPQLIERLILTAWFDDGFVAYINGMEFVRVNVEGEPKYDSLASDSSEADISRQFVIDNPSAYFQSGTNTLAVIGMNSSIDSSDLSLAIRLEAILREGGSLKLKGVSDALQTRWVRVNGNMAQYEPWLAQWSYPLELQQGRNVITIEALNAAKQVVYTTKTLFYLGEEPATDGRETVGDETWTTDQSPIQIDQNIIVYPTDTLTIQRGVIVNMAPASGIIVYGTFVVEGTENDPIQFHCQDPEQKWGGILFDEAVGKSRIHNATIIQSATLEFRNKTYKAGITVIGSTAEITGCDISVDGFGIKGHRAFLTIRENHFYDMGEMLYCNTCLSIVENNRFHHTLGYSDCIDFDGQLRYGSIIRGNIISDSGDDGIDIGNASPLIEGNWIRNCANKGISLEGESVIYVFNNVITRCDIGLAIKDSSTTTLLYGTIASCTTGVSLYEKNEGKGGGIVDMINCVIWDTQNSLLVDSHSIAIVKYSDLMQLPEDSHHTNFSQDPLFADVLNGNMQPKPGSPLIDTGTITDLSLIDINGNSRPYGSAPDIGAYEIQPVTELLNWNLY